MANRKSKEAPPSIDEWLREAKAAPGALQEGMFLIHNGVVRETSKARVRQGLDDGSIVKGIDFSYDIAKIDTTISETRKMDGIFSVRVWLNEGRLKPGEDIMYVLVGGDIRSHVVDAFQFLVEKIKSECVTERELK